MKTALSEDRVLTRDEVQSFFGISKRFLELAAARGDGPPYLRLGRNVRYRVADVRAWLQEQTHDGAGQ